MFCNAPPPSCGHCVYLSCVCYQVFLFRSYPVLILHLISQLVDLPLQFTDGVCQDSFVPAHSTNMLENGLL